MPRIGDLVKLVAVPPWVADLEISDVQEIYQFSLGRTFEVRDVRGEDGRMALWLEPSDNPFGDQVDELWVEAEYVEVVATKESRR
jgi:hypothetical protein